MFDNELPIEILDYLEFLYAVKAEKVPFVTKERIRKNFNNYGEAINTLMVYPDIFSDIMTPSDSSFSMFFSQRILLRSMARSVQSFNTFTRAFSKSFCAFFFLYMACMFLPRTKAFIVAGTKGQAANIAREKVIDDLWVKFPMFANEMQKFRRAGQLKNAFQDSADTVAFNFTNGSIMDVIGGKVRGGRRTLGLFEEVIDQDQVYINESVIPLLNTTRTDKKNNINPYEPQGRQVYITTAGYQNTFSYDKLLETLCFTAIDPDNYCVLGGSYILPVIHGRLSQETIRRTMSSPSYSSESFDREYRSIWSSSVQGAAVDANTITKLRKIKRAEYKASQSAIENGDFYVVCADIAYDGAADTAVTVARVSVGELNFTYKVINEFAISGNFESMANTLKRTVNNYEARMLIYDANGVGAPLREWLNRDSYDQGEKLDGFGIINPPDKIDVIKYRDKTRDICYEIKSGGAVSSKIHRLFFSKLRSSHIYFLVKSSEALAKFQDFGSFAMANSVKQEEIMRPYKTTDLMEKQMRNLDIKDTIDKVTSTLIIERRDTKIQKDFFSSMEYLIWGCSEYLELPYYKKKREDERKNLNYSFVSQAARYSSNNQSRRNKQVSRRRSQR